MDKTKNAHLYSQNNFEVILESKVCGCYYCYHIFKPSEIQIWVDNGRTPICPYCDIDSVIGDKSGLVITEELLEKMGNYWFRNGERDES